MALGGTLMPHGLSVDRTATDVLRRNGIFQDRGSFLSHRDLANDRAHVHLEGPDRSAARERAWKRAKGKCAICRRELDSSRWELHHPGTCDCTDPKCPTHVEVRCSQFETDCHKHHSKNFKRHAAQEKNI